MTGRYMDKKLVNNYFKMLGFMEKIKWIMDNETTTDSEKVEHIHYAIQGWDEE